MPAPRRPRIGLALGSGSARGWSHIGVIRALEQAGYAPDVVCGTSIGALVGAVHAAGRLDWLDGWVRQLSWQGVVSLMDFRMGGGLIEGAKLTGFFRRHFEDRGIEGLARPFACVATELGTGREVWLREGPVIEAVRASIALPGLFTPAQLHDRLLVDGGLVNPVPVSLCRAMGAEVVGRGTGRRGDPPAPVGHRGHGFPPRRAGHRAGRGGGAPRAAAAGGCAGRTRPGGRAVGPGPGPRCAGRGLSCHLTQATPCVAPSFTEGRLSRALCMEQGPPKKNGWPWPPVLSSVA
ncbi:patatin-like phospholipase family protein [Xenophilus sp. Marseille-Q4582]|uniref:patatin-like phospholipase family protein n=1 Tax=Xenophilus sp. Marseille-Q4582 TaxID=2866600 RepID=UPI001CE484A0|nr:patatin-like phospholipase family protein [Xenophilus sp. Marseille-Q4582]